MPGDAAKPDMSRRLINAARSLFGITGGAARRIDYEILPSARRRTMCVEVHPDLRVVVRVPLRCARREIEEWVSSRSDWIERQLARFRRRPPPRPAYRYVTGEPHRYLGRAYPLRLRADGAPGVELGEDGIAVTAADCGEPERVRELLAAWYFRQAATVFAAVLAERHAAFFAARGHRQPQLTVKTMRRRWGSLSPLGRMNLNADLIRAPRGCIEMVVVHELCHLEHHHHDAGFYRLMGLAMPDWQQWKAQLHAPGAVD